MGINKCCVGGCNATSETHRLFRFPKIDKLRDLWVSFVLPTNPRLIGLTKYQLIDRRVCEKHFDKQQFDEEGRRLRYSYPCLITGDEIARGEPLPAPGTMLNAVADHNYCKEQDDEEDLTGSSDLVILKAADKNFYGHPTCLERREEVLEQPPCSFDEQIEQLGESSADNADICHEIIIENKIMKKIDTCRICFTGSCYKNINNEYAYRGELENYGKMLRDTFNLVLKSKRSLICEKCVTKLRDATKFREKIVNAEKYLLEMNEQVEEKFDSDLELDSDIELKHEKKHTEVKSECKTIIGFKGEDFIITLGKTPIKRKQDMNYETSDYEYQDEVFDSISEEKVTKNVTMFIKNDKLKNKLTKKTAADTPKISSTQKHLNENTHKLIVNSNLCIFKSLRTKFACTYCSETFFDVQELRKHWPAHSNMEFKCKKLRGLSYKNAEISDLKCRICEQNTENLDTLRSHLESHNIEFKGEGKHLLIPYKLEEGFQCVICHESFNTFTRLVIHMNSHSTQNVCEKCGLSYFNRISLRNHIRNQHYYKKCAHCHMTFLTISDKAKHMKKIHRLGYEKRYCLRCDMTFPNTYQLVQHSIEKHGFKDLTVSCQHCGKVLKTPTNLKIHIRSVHLKERNFPCHVCDMRFFTKNDKERHEKTHLDMRSYSCNFCEIKFKSKDSVRRHLKRQHGQGKDLREFVNTFTC